MATYHSRAPVRIDFGGGTTDLKAFREREVGAVLSGALARYAYCSLTDLPDTREVRLRALDLEAIRSADSIREIEHSGSTQLLTRALATEQFALQGLGMEVTVRSDSPAGSGTGASASVGVALLGLLEYRHAETVRTRHRLSRYALAEMACDIEAEMGIVGGKQDQYAAALGGINYIEFYQDHVSVQPVEVGAGVIADLEKHLVLCYSGESRLSGDTNSRMIEAYERGEEVVVESLRTVKRVAQEAADALRGANMAQFARLLDEEYEARIRLAEGVLTPRMAEMVAAGKREGALAAKICGAGGGGCLLFYCAPYREGPVRRALEALGGRILDSTFDFGGLQVWRMER